MYFQSLPNQYKRIREHRWKIATGVLLGVGFLVWSSIFTFNQPTLTLEQTNEKINQSERLKEVDTLCANLPKPEDFRLLRKKISGNSRTTSISHYYQSKTEYEKIKKFYSDWFIQNGWKLEYQNTLDFNKDNLMIRINKAYSNEAKYVIYCAKES